MSINEQFPFYDPFLHFNHKKFNLKILNVGNCAVKKRDLDYSNHGTTIQSTWHPGDFILFNEFGPKTLKSNDLFRNRWQWNLKGFFNYQPSEQPRQMSSNTMTDRPVNGIIQTEYSDAYSKTGKRKNYETRMKSPFALLKILWKIILYLG